MNMCITSSSSVKDEKYIELTDRYISQIIDMDVTLICGGVSSSMMKRAYEVFAYNKKKVKCYTLACYNEEEICPDTVLLDTTFDRTKKLYEDSDIICVFPGGSGSLSELFSFIEEARTQVLKPIIVVNENHFFDLILEHMHKLINEGFNSDSILNYIDVVTDTNQFKKKLEEYYGKINNG